MNPYKEILPDGCPPYDAKEANGVIFFRLVSTFPPAATDFLSPKALNPSRDFKAKECESRSLSVLINIKSAIDILKLPTQHGKLIAKLPLISPAGMHEQTGSRHDHHSWWMYHDFNPIPVCELVSLPEAE